MHPARTLMIVLPLISGLLLTLPAIAETWTDVTGKHRIEAQFLSVSGGNVYLQKEDGTTIAVPINRLSPESLALAKRRYQEALSTNGSTPPPAAPAMAAPAALGQSKLGANPTARETAEALGVALAEFDMVTIWDAFPAKQQTDIEEVMRLAANSIDSATWSSVASLLKKASKLVGEKKEFFLKNSLLAGAVPDTPETHQMWDAAAELLGSYTNSSITDQDAMKNFSMSQFIAGDVPKIRSAFEKLQSLTVNLQDSPFNNVAALPTIETVSESASEAVFKITQGGQTTEQTFVKADNRWVPVEMVKDWDQDIAEAKMALQGLSKPEAQQGMAAARAMLLMAEGQIDLMLAAQTQEQFDKVVNDIVDMVTGMMGGMPGGFGPGGPGGAPPADLGDAPPFPGFGDDADLGDAPPFPGSGE
jgi:hypothetical protein